MPQHQNLTLERLKEVLSYDPLSGDLTWLVTLSNRNKRGSKAGCWSIRDGYLIGIDGRLYKAHRLAWFYMTGKWPKFQVDHKDVNNTNNRWKNLRDATNQQNAVNRHRHTNNKSGYKNVVFYSKRPINPYRAEIMVNGKHRHLGYFASAQEASLVAQNAARKYFGEFARAN